MSGQSMTLAQAVDAMGPVLQHADLTPREVAAVSILREHARASIELEEPSATSPSTDDELVMRGLQAMQSQWAREFTAWRAAPRLDPSPFVPATEHEHLTLSDGTELRHRTVKSLQEGTRDDSARWSPSLDEP